MTTNETNEYPPKETYDTTAILQQLQKIESNPDLLAKFNEGSAGRAEDMFESGKVGQFVKSGEKVAYIGAGSGHFAKLIEDRTDSQVFKLDLTDIRYPNIKDGYFVLGNARHLPFQDQSLDTVFLPDMLHHCQNQSEIISEASRVLIPGGKLLLFEDTLPDKKSPLRIAFSKIVGIVDDSLNLQPKGVNPHNYHSIPEWLAIFQTHGFSCLDVEKWYWGPKDFLPKSSRTDRVDHRTIMRPFESTRFVFATQVV